MKGLWTLAELEARNAEVASEDLNIRLAVSRVEGQLARSRRLKREAEEEIPLLEAELEKLFGQMAETDARLERSKRDIAIYKDFIQPMEKAVGVVDADAGLVADTSIFKDQMAEAAVPC